MRIIALLLTLAAAAPAFAIGHAATPRGIWVGTFTLGRTEATAIGVAFAGSRATVTFPAGHAALDTVPVRNSAGHVRFTVPGRPPLVFDGRINGTRFSGSTRQGGAGGTFALKPVRTLPASGALGLYRLENGSTVGLLGN